MSLRLFTAIALPAEIRARLAGLAGGFSGARRVAEENLHLSLVFIGQVPAARLADIDEALADVRGAAFDLALDGVGHFGNARRVRVLWAGVAANPALAALQSRIAGALRPLRHGIEERAYTPHVTLARFRAPPPPKRLGPWLEANGFFRAGPVRVEAFTLYSSILTGDGAHYRVEASYPLGGD
ncbi:MAG: RNA 2',3'-cyclic phosphodiesterase [Alphaproteobacteria bacterium]